MKSLRLLPISGAAPTVLRRSVVAVAIASACAGAMAVDLPQFSFNPGAAGLTGAAFTGDNILISDYSTVTTTSPTTFNETGFLAISGIQLGGATLTPGGLNSTYGLYIAFTGAGTSTAGNPATTVSTGSFTSLDYTLFGYNGMATFGFTGNTPTETATGEVALATGRLISGTVVSVPAGGGAFTPSASAQLTFAPTAAGARFFATPTPFYNNAFAAFTNTPSQVEPFTGGFRIRQGGGAFNYAAVTPIPEPETYALMLAGLAGVGLLSFARRRRS